MTSLRHLDFEELLRRAVWQSGSEVNLARQVRLNKNNIRQWRIGLALPSRDAAQRLATIIGITFDVMRRAIRDEMVLRWDTRWNNGSSRRRGPRPGPRPRTGKDRT